MNRHTLARLALALPLTALAGVVTTPSRAHAQVNPAVAMAACTTAPILRSGQVVTGNTAGMPDRFHGTCADGTASPDTAYRIIVSQPAHLHALLESDYDAALYLRNVCATDAPDLACNDDTGDTSHAQIDQVLAPGSYLLVVDGYNATNAGRFTLSVQLQPLGAAPGAAAAQPGVITPLPPSNPGGAPGYDPAANPQPNEPGVITPLPPHQGGQVAFDPTQPGVIMPLPPTNMGAAPPGPDGNGATQPVAPSGTVQPGSGQGPIRGTVRFSKRMFTPHGLSAQTQERPAQHIVVEAVGPDGRAVATGETDDNGQFSLQVAPGTSVRVRALSRTTYLGHDLRVVDAPGSERLYEVSSDYFPARGGETVSLHATVGGDEPAGAFNIMNGFVRMLPYVQRGFRNRLPPLYAFWRRGNNRSLPVGSITAYIREYRQRPGTYALQIQGGEPGREDASDSDQFDDVIVLHEFTHFVIDRLSGSFSLGGSHGGGELHMPGLALNEAVASVVASAVLGDARYWDSAGVEPQGRIFINHDQESMPERVRGVGSEASCQMIQWDLVDGGEGIADRDNDGVGIGLTGLFRIYDSFHDDPDRFPGIATVLDRGVELGLFTRAQAAALTQRPEPHNFTLPPTGDDVYPLDVPLPGRVAGKVDGLSNPAPSGGRNTPYNGFDAVRVFRVRVREPRVLTVRLSIEGPGSQESGTDLDLALMDRNMDSLGVSNGTGPTEQISARVQPGTYIIFVRDGDQGSAAEREGTRGNRANFTLDVQ